ncbi:MAG: dihydropteroate synthase, partial [Anaerolineae bacterium]|nr:dihydropteroate synthase [Anaerolineae bacterium]
MTRFATLRLRQTEFLWGSRTYIMGILNLTPDSFSGDGLLNQADFVAAALAQAQAMLDEGADLLDLGGESTRP